MDTYEAELERAELLGVEPISREKWEVQALARAEVALEQEKVEMAEVIEAIDEKSASNHGKMDELNSILNATQMKINKFKTVCGSFTSLLRIRTASPAPSEDGASTSNGQAPTSSINDALDNLEEMKRVQAQTDVQFVKGEAQNITKKLDKNLNALDSLIAKADRADTALQQQNKQLKSLLK